MFEVKVKFMRAKQGGLVEAPEGRNTISLEVDGFYVERFEVHAELGDVAAKYITARELIWEVGSELCFEQAAESLRECTGVKDGHENCRAPDKNVLPTRVIDCQDPTKPRQLYIPAAGIRDFYATLSYAINLAILPQTIREAIFCTSKIGLRYLWVDALCILQDSKADKQVEIAPRKVSEGFLHNRDPPPACMRLPFICPDDDRIGTMLLREPRVEKMEDTPVNSRAWCLEELLLSRRVLIYASHTLQFGCVSKHPQNVGNATNAMFSTNLRLEPFMFLVNGRRDEHYPLSDSEEVGLRNSWNAVIAEYTRRDLTRPKDRLIVLEGVAEEFQRFWTTSQYLAGLWRHNLLEDLLWEKVDDGKQISRPMEFRAPTWSWASVDGSVSAAERMTLLWPTNCRYLCEVIRCETTLVNAMNLFGEVSGGVLEMKAMLKEAWWNPITSTLSFIEAGNREDLSGPNLDSTVPYTAFAVENTAVVPH
ncbi:hypothetical protein C8R44DRAFT_981972 [Mycena epipterygia]|nr:hypothetical protein C8R44DRAFT_981972 [Mycena epipterygia]